VGEQRILSVYLSLHIHIKGSNRNMDVEQGHRNELFENYRRKNRIRNDISNSDGKVE
jgi:hypothetical protein